MKRGQGRDPEQKRSQRGHSTTGNSDQNRQRQNGDSSFQHRCAVSEQVHWLAAERPSNLGSHATWGNTPELVSSAKRGRSTKRHKSNTDADYSQISIRR